MGYFERLLTEKGIYVDKFIVGRHNSDIASLIMQSFHAKEVVHVKRNDSYFMHIRANNFVVEIGELDYEVPISEETLKDLNDKIRQLLQNSISDFNFALVTGNHKGVRATTIWVIPNY